MINMLTAVADAYYDSTPTMFFTAHNSEIKRPEMRVENNQEIDTVTLASSVTKYAVRIDDVAELRRELRKAYAIANTGRKGPVFLDIASSVLRQEVDPDAMPDQKTVQTPDVSEISDKIAAKLRKAKRPVILIGAGVRQSGTEALVRKLAEEAGIPVLSSRICHDIMPDSPMYFGFVGSHGTRYSNFMLSKTDLILALGNRMAFPVRSESFRPVVEKADIIRVDIDKSEFLRDLPGSVGYVADLREFLPELLKRDFAGVDRTAWLNICNDLKRSLWQWDKTPIIAAIMRIIETAGKETALVCDVGNHGFLVTNACVYLGAVNRTLYSGSFGTLGNALPKAIGACCGTGHPVLCFTGDQGFQMNIQELGVIAQYHLPLAVVVINNFASAMIREREESQFSHFVHTTLESGYSVPNLQAVADAYHLEYLCIEDTESFEPIIPGDRPCLVELRVDEAERLCPNLPQGNPCQDLAPAIPEDLYRRLESLE